MFTRLVALLANT